ncbi:MAG: tetratricopeptide repeat protein [Actinomycetota bacterium]|nr:tetratricopeptide repeat protein [Actinomycetota bacterium]
MTKSSPSTVRVGLPEGTVTFLFTDIEGSTRLLQLLGEDYSSTLAAHQKLLRTAFMQVGGREVGTQGDAFFVAFASAQNAVLAAVEGQRALQRHDWPHGEPVRVRMGVHTGEPLVIENDYVGIDVHRAARICSAAHGEQVVISSATKALLNRKSLSGIILEDLGSHRLKDLDHSEHLWQLTATDLTAVFPPLRSAKPPSNVPHHLGALVGRHSEADELRQHILNDESRLVTVTGPGGTGKTRLTAAVAVDLLDSFADGVFFVDLSSVPSADLVAPEIARALEIPLKSDRSPTEALTAHFGSRNMLLLLDNFEQVLAGAPVVADLLRACHGLTILVTSRVSLSLRGEQEYPLPPLGLPEVATREAVERSEAAQLFIKRAAEALPSFKLTDRNATAVAEICRLLDGLPLAIELAAARIKLLSPDAILRRLDDRFSLLTGGDRDYPVRHRALRTTVDWSYDLLSKEEKAVFRDLSVFGGGASLDAIERVIVSETDVLATLASLVNHSLIRQREDADGEIRFRMLETIREYALELLDTHPTSGKVRDRHARYYLELAEGMAGGDEQEQSEAKLKVEAEQDNMRAALKWWLQDRADEDGNGSTLGLRLASALGGYWYKHSGAVEGAAWLERALSISVDAPDKLRADALRLLGVLMDQQNQLDRAGELLREALSYFQKLGDRKGEASALNSLGVVTRSLRDFDSAEKLYRASVAIRRELDDPSLSATLSNLGILHLDRGQPEPARRLLEEVMKLDRNKSDDWGMACTLNNLGFVYLEQGDSALARRKLIEGTQSFVKLGDLDGVAEGLEATACVDAAEGQPVRAARIAGAADCLRRSLGIPLGPLEQEHLDRWLAKAQSALGEPLYRQHWGEGAAMTLDQATHYALGPLESVSAELPLH